MLLMRHLPHVYRYNMIKEGGLEQFLLFFLLIASHILGFYLPFCFLEGENIYYYVVYISH